MLQLAAKPGLYERAVDLVMLYPPLGILFHFYPKP